MSEIKVGAHSQFHPLKEVWIGGTYPEHFYNHYDSKTQDVFGHITEITNDDFNKLEKIISGLNVRVVRPEFNASIDQYMDSEGNLLKPPISPTDFAFTLNDTLYYHPLYESGVNPYQHAIDLYLSADQKVKILDRSSDSLCWVSFASVVRAGKDLFLDYDKNNHELAKNTLAVANEWAKDYRVHLSKTGDHSDGVFCPLNPGNIISSHYRKSYLQSFPGWKTFWLPNKTTFKQFKTHQKWWMPGVDYGHFNDQIVAVANDWIGYSPETVFDVNILVIDEHNIVCSGQDDKAFKYFESIGVTPHVIDFKSRYFWDAGIHCITSDIYRIGVKEDYWPDRGPNGIYNISEWE